MKNKGSIVIFSAGIIIGSALEYLCTRKCVKAQREISDQNYELYQKQLEKANGLVEENQQLDLELRQCKLTNWQCTTYATRLKKQLDEFME